MIQNKLFEPFPKQAELIRLVLSRKYDTIIYGGAFGGGKSYVACAVACMLAKMYAKSKWIILREDMPVVESTIHETFTKIYPSHYFKKKRSRPTIIYEGLNGSQIIFMGENFEKDKDLQRFKSLECNGFIIEQIEGIREHTFEICQVRAGRWKVKSNPPKLVLATTNPTQGWQKERFYRPYNEGTLPPKMHFLEAKVYDNPILANDKEYMSGFDYMDPISKARYLDGDWDAAPLNNAWIYEWDEAKFCTTGLTINKDWPIYLNFDFNVDPMTCTIEQHGHDWSHWIKEVRQRNSDIYQLCDQLIAMFGFGNRVLMITGDASGHSRNSIAKADMNTHYKAIKILLGLLDRQVKVFKRNPYHNQSRIFINGFLYNFPEVLIDKEGCPQLIKDLKLTEALPDGHIDKKKYDPHSLDSWRYGVHMWHKDWMKRLK